VTVPNKEGQRHRSCSGNSSQGGRGGAIGSGGLLWIRMARPGRRVRCRPGSREQSACSRWRQLEHRGSCNSGECLANTSKKVGDIDYVEVAVSGGGDDSGSRRRVALEGELGWGGGYEHGEVGEPVMRLDDGDDSMMVGSGRGEREWWVRVRLNPCWNGRK
jgi:hypothetical protein